VRYHNSVVIPCSTAELSRRAHTVAVSLPWLDAGYTSLLIENGTMQRSVRPWQYDASKGSKPTRLRRPYAPSIRRRPFRGYDL